MNKKQWYALSIWSFLMGMLFEKMALFWKGLCNNAVFIEEVSNVDIYVCVRDVVFSSWVYVWFGLMLVFLVCAWLEAKK